jgi:prepilin-type N-terminal cleavage/methylation domain-containing protein
MTLALSAAPALPAISRSDRRSRSRGFTLIEIMVVVSLMGLLITGSIPFVYRMLHRDPLNQAISNITEACGSARAAAILRGVPASLRIDLENRTLRVNANTGRSTTSGAHTAPAVSTTGWHIPDEVIIETLDVNFIEKKDERETQINFYPNGICDEFTVVLFWPDKNQHHKISLDIITSLTTSEAIQ